ncbi:serine hydrolase [Lewinella sp. W8]|uniref:serine hydrolase domain-containing protein n=1 Tax=Lewinella sp. W8 TaxID=2528208 RepID=UPI001067740F|nr:serine hydrolase [Lewinella sp. W8]MTB51848.1 serine hydrolase [Lewinella sp. W8]
MKKLFLPTLLLSVIFSACHVPRFFTRNKANITDYKIFPYTPVGTNPDNTFEFPPAKKRPLANFRDNYHGEAQDLTTLLDKTSTTAFLVVHRDSIVYENYFEGREPDDISTFFSVSKSVTSLLVGIAVDEGLIEDINDPITKYIPELPQDDPDWQKLTIKHLLNMRSGLNFREAYGSPFAHVAKLYYGTNQLKQISKYQFNFEPGSVHQYQSVSTALLGIAVEKVTGLEIGQYLEEKVWKPMGMEFDATWSVDDKKNRSGKTFCCLNATARDLAKIGRLYLNDGNWNGQQIISREWVEASTTPNMENDNYQYQWYGRGGIARKDGQQYTYPDSLAAVEGARSLGIPHFYVDPLEAGANEWHIHYASNDFYALGIMNQYLFVDPDREVIIVRLGRKYDDGYLGLFTRISRHLGG